MIRNILFVLLFTLNCYSVKNQIANYILNDIQSDVKVTTRLIYNQNTPTDCKLCHPLVIRLHFLKLLDI